MQTDPIGYKDDMDLYSYVGNDPLNKTDPTGLQGGNCHTIDAGGGYSCDYTEAGNNNRPSGGVPQQFQNLQKVADAAQNASTVVDAVNDGLGTTATVATTIVQPEIGIAKIAGAGILKATFVMAAKEKPALSAYKTALGKVHDLVGKQPKGEIGKFGSPQAGTSKVGYRLDPPHTGVAEGEAESMFHFNYWDYSAGKRGSGGISGAISIE